MATVEKSSATNSALVAYDAGTEPKAGTLPAGTEVSAKVEGSGKQQKVVLTIAPPGQPAVEVRFDSVDDFMKWANDSTRKTPLKIQQRRSGSRLRFHADRRHQQA